MSDNTLKVYWAAVRGSFKVFLQQAIATLLPGTPFLDNWHIDAIVHCLEQALAGKMPRLIVNLPPRHLKSLLLSVMWPAFVMGHDPTAKFICVSYSDELARSLARDFRRLVESDWYPAVFPEFKATKSTEGEVVTDQGGYRYTTSVGGTLTGRGGDFIIIDDPIKADDAASDKAREGVNEWFRTTLLSRLNDKEFSVLILAMQRTHVNDLAGNLEGQGGFHKLALAAIAKKDEVIATGPGQFHRRLAGEALHPERESLKAHEAMRNNVGPAIFNAQYQQTPEAPDGNLFKLKYFEFIDKPPVLLDGTLFVSIDSALSTADTADFTAVSLVLGQQGKFYVLRAERGRWDFDALRLKAWAYVNRYGSSDRPLCFVIEKAGSGISLLSHLNNAIGRGEDRLLCFHYSPKQDKMTRAALTLPFFEEGRVVIVNQPGRNAWVEDYVNEFLCFPNGRFDDQVDSLVQLLMSRRSLYMADVPF
jgi:predicted phage terminase large subunit-like protein